jgi:ketosteroid isomerase-like protein
MHIRDAWFLGLVLLAGCAQAPAEQRLRERIGAMQDAIVARDVAAFMDGVAADFIGSGGVDRAALQQLVRLQVMRNASIGATLGPMRVELQGERAMVEFDAVLTGGSGGLLPEHAQGYRVRSGWRDGGEGWQVYNAEWKPAL